MDYLARDEVLAACTLTITEVSEGGRGRRDH